MLGQYLLMSPRLNLLGFPTKRMPNGAISEFPSCFRDEFIQMLVDGFQFCSLFLHRQTFPVFFRVMMAQLESSVKSIPAGKPSDSSEVGKHALVSQRREGPKLNWVV